MGSGRITVIYVKGVSFLGELTNPAFALSSIARENALTAGF